MRKIIALLLVALMAGCAQQPVMDTTVPIKILSQSMAGPEVAAELNTLYQRRFPNCNNSDSQPAFLCSGVTLRVTVKDPANKYKVWDPSPTSEASGGVSFSYLRADSNFGQLAWGNTNGLIFYPIFGAPPDKIDVDYLCAYPMDGWNWYRTSPCGTYAPYPDSGACHTAGVSTAEQWLAKWNGWASDKNRRQCSFDIRDERNALAGPAFYQFVRAKGMLGAVGFSEQNEIVVKTWTAGRPNTLPLMAFFYVQGGPNTALADARYNQQDFYNSTNPHITVPIIRLTLPASSTGTANFSYVAADQVLAP
ncbi:halovibrin HvnC [Pseudomonas sp. TH03]|uniref:halovibrin HvnC n=1 Tax=Pseudomonas sp. TH03 TaxID=2796369 RepID=UPI001911707F|nr:halovibrin HvnC [Pseudomonas sp. TH03]MBK5554115.1 halovibrin HvnC [Pseudomonas sp. TH03]